MQQLIERFKQIKPFKILAILGVCLMLITTTACNRGDITGARPQNPPVQAGGQNNPHKMGGDGLIKSTPSKAGNVKTIPSTK
jgi:hypothetical protein